MFKLYVWKGSAGLLAYDLSFFEFSEAVKYARVLAKENRLRKVNREYIWCRAGDILAENGVISSVAIDTSGVGG